jgi:hypothetical protein
VSAAIIAFLCFACVVQWNDPDPVRWAALYGTAAVVTALVAWGGIGPAAPAALGIISIAWGVALLPSAAGTSFPELFRTWEMMSPGMEVGRESLGLVVVAAWMIVLVRRAGARAP